MAENSLNDMSAEMPDADIDISIPPIDNIHAPKPELDLPPLPETPQEPARPQMPLQTGAQLDTEMAEAVPTVMNQQPIVAPNSASQQRTATPNRHVNGIVETASPMPSKAAAHGAPARRYLNEKVTGVLLEGMKRLAADRPEEPLRVLGEFLLQKSKELEGTT